MKSMRVIGWGSAVVVLTSSCAAAPINGQVVPQDRSNMDARLQQIITLLQEPTSCGAAEAAIGLGLETLYGGLRPLPSRDLPEETTEADRKISGNERRFAQVLNGFVRQGRCPELHAMALDLKLFVEQMNEVAVAVGRITAQCGLTNRLQVDPCDQLLPLLDEETGHEIVTQRPRDSLRVSFSVKLRSPFVPWRHVYGWEENVVATEPLGPGVCSAVVKETRGLMLRLHLSRLTVIKDPWATPLLARGTKIPVWSLEWVPSQYVKTWNICNVDGRLRTTVSQRVKQDIPLNFFWRYYRASGTKAHMN